MKDTENHEYDDIINLPHHISKKHKHMSIEDRAMQFAPFSVLDGYEDTIKKVIETVENS